MIVSSIPATESDCLVSAEKVFQILRFPERISDASQQVLAHAMHDPAPVVGMHAERE